MFRGGGTFWYQEYPQERIWIVPQGQRGGCVCIEEAGLVEVFAAYMEIRGRHVWGDAYGEERFMELFEEYAGG